ncbi:MAG: orotate phosphoribosyltransferase, partial [Anaerolineae bacterium]|nr:orotate phosphoribosyltransferase [Anaerolineae bacterium]
LDLRMLASRPDVLWQVARAYARLLQGLSYDRLAAIPYAALPIGSAVALLTGRPLIYPRLEARQHGTRRRIEGAWNRGETAVVLDDVLTTGASKLEAIHPLQEAGLVVHDIVVLIDRGQGGRQALEREGYRVHALLDLRQIVDVLARLDLISAPERERVTTYLEAQKP